MPAIAAATTVAARMCVFILDTSGDSCRHAATRRGHSRLTKSKTLVDSEPHQQHSDTRIDRGKNRMIAALFRLGLAADVPTARRGFDEVSVLRSGCQAQCRSHIH